MRATDSTAERIAAELETQLGMIATIWKLKDPYCGGALEEAVPGIAQYWANRARESSAVAHALEFATGGGGWLGMLTVHAPLIMAITQHHVAPAIQARRAAQLGIEPEPVTPQVFQPAHQDPTTGETVAGRWEPVDTTHQGPLPADGLGGTAPDPAAEAAAAAWVQENLGTEPQPVWVDQAAWDEAEAMAARDAATAAGIPWGIATYDGTPAFAPPADDGATS